MFGKMDSRTFASKALCKRTLTNIREEGKPHSYQEPLQLQLVLLDFISPSTLCPGWGLGGFKVSGSRADNSKGFTDV